MSRKGQIKKDVLVFCQWSRKGYAIFASLKKVVSIARLSVDICKSVLLKISLIHFTSIINPEEELDNSDIIDINENPILMPNTLPVFGVFEDIYPQFRINNFPKRKPIFCRAHNMGFLF